MGGTNTWADTSVGNSSDIDSNHMRYIGCAVTALTNAANTLNGTNFTPGDTNSSSELFPDSSSDDKKSDIDFSGFAKSQGLTLNTISPGGRSGLKDKLDNLSKSGTSYAVIAQVKYKNGSDNGHFVGVNGVAKLSDGKDYLEISPTSGNDYSSSERRSDWKHENGKIYVPLSDVLRLNVLSKEE
jgi:hypothetical protein